LPPPLSIILPAHNEQDRLPDSLTRILAFLAAHSPDAEIIVVENGSTDRTAEVAEAFARKHAGLRVLREPRRGKGPAAGSAAPVRSASTDPHRR